MTVLEVMLTIALAVTVPGVVWLAVDTRALRRDIDRLDGEVSGRSAHDDLSDKYHHSWGRQLWDHHLRIAALEDAGHLLPDLPPSDHEDARQWRRDGLLITPGGGPGDVLIEWDENDVAAGLPLTPDQVQAIIAAHYHREDQT